MSVVHSHRHNKKEETAIVKRDIDFDVVRDTMYKYSKKAQQKFFGSIQLSFLFVWFLDSPESCDLLNEKFGDKGQDYLHRMRQDLGELREEALASLKISKDPRAPIFFGHLLSRQ